MQEIKQGDILHAVYSYSSQHNHFYEVVKSTGKTVTLREIARRHVTDDGYGQNGTEVPLVVDGVPVARGTEELKNKRIQYTTAGAPYVRTVPAGYAVSVARLWDGQPKEFYTD